MLKIHYFNPAAKTYQYEYAMYLAVSEMFHSVVTRSMNLKSLELYFADLITESKTGVPNYSKQEKVKEEMKQLVERDVVGKIKFPQMNRCKAELTIRKNSDDTHSFVFSDGIYQFSVRLKDIGEGNKKIITQAA